MGKVVLLNTSILTAYGSFKYTQISLDDVIRLTSDGFESAIGHDSTAKILTSLIGQEVKTNRIQYKQEIRDIAIIFKLNGRPEEGKIITVDEIETIGYEFGILIRNS